MIIKTLKATVIASALIAAFPYAASAQSTTDLKKEIELLRAQLDSLQKKVDAQQSAAPAAGAVEPSEFNRIKIKTEGIEDSIEAQGLKQLKISGMMDPTYIYNQKQNTSSFSFLNNFAGGAESFAYDNSYFGMAVLDFQKETTDGTRWRLTLAPHKSVGSNYNFPSIVHEASVSMPLWDIQNRVWAGQIPDWSGYEYYLANQTKFVTHGMMFDFLAPTFYTGIGTDFTSGKWQIKTTLANMNSARYNIDPNTGTALRAPMFSTRIDYSKGEYDGWGAAIQAGKTTNNVAGGTSQLLNGEVDAYFIRGDLTLQGQLNYGTQKNAAFNGGDATWYGLSALGAYKFTPRLEGALRFDYINNAKNGGGTFNIANGSCTLPVRDALGAVQFDAVTGDLVTAAGACADSRNGFGPGMALQADSGLWEIIDPNKGTNRFSLTYAMNYLFSPSTTLKFELRGDRASQPVFLNTNDGSYGKSNFLIGSSVVVSF